jgi:hypothetical protein
MTNTKTHLFVVFLFKNNEKVNGKSVQDYRVLFPSAVCDVPATA